MNIAAKVLACILVLILHIAISLSGGFILMVGMNGFPGGNIPTIGFVFFLIWGIVTVIILLSLSYFGVGFLADKKQMNQYLSTVIAIFVSTILSGIIMFVGLVASLFLVSTLWDYR